MSTREQANKILRDVGAILLRKKKHEVYQLPDGRRFVRSSTPGCVSSSDNNLAELKTALGLHNEQRGAEGERREKKAKRQKAVERARFDKPVGSLADQLRRTGLVEDALRSQIETLTTERDQLYSAVVAILKRPCTCWWCGVKRRFRGQR